jgi:hypothetical protein
MVIVFFLMLALAAGTRSLARAGAGAVQKHKGQERRLSPDGGKQHV